MTFKIFPTATATAANLVPAASSSAAPHAGNDRLVSLDALRGFDMFWIIGGTGLSLYLAKILGFGENPPWLHRQLTHSAWNGCTFYDLIFPLFVFLVGVAMPYSLSKHIERGESKARLYWRICRRTVLLALMGVVGNMGFAGLRNPDFANLRYPSVLGRIGLAYFFAALIVLNTSIRGRVAWIAILLLGYWAAMMLIPVPGFGAGNINPGKTLASYIDRSVLPGRLLAGNRDPNGILPTLGAIASALLGVLAGQWLRESRRDGHVKAAVLLIACVICLALGYLWDRSFPINKRLWSSSFVLWAGGWSLMLLGLFYLVIDVWGWKKWGFVFGVIGANAITIYVGQQIIDLHDVWQCLYGNAPVDQNMLAAASLPIKWFVLYILYRQRIFLRL